MPLRCARLRLHKARHRFHRRLSDYAAAAAGLIRQILNFAVGVALPFHDLSKKVLKRQKAGAAGPPFSSFHASEC
jgi:hypothetical protein